MLSRRRSRHEASAQTGPRKSARPSRTRKGAPPSRARKDAPPRARKAASPARARAGAGLRLALRPDVLALACFIVALVVRLNHLDIVSSNPYFQSPILDEADHHAWAADIVRGDGGEYLPFYRAPGYPYSLAALYAITGPEIPAGRLLSAIFGALTVALAFAVGLRLAGRAAALTAAAILAIYPTALYFDGMLLGASLDAMLFMLSLLLLMSVTEAAGEEPASPRAAGGRALGANVKLGAGQRLGSILALGAALGLATITRPLMALLLPVALAFTFLRRRSQWVRDGALIVAAWALPVALVTAANLVGGGEPVLVASNGGINFFLGNNPDANGWSPSSPEIRGSLWLGALDAERIASRQLGHEASPREISSYWWRRGLDFIVRQPLDWIGLMGRKLTLLIGASEIENNQNIDAFRRYSPWLRTPLLAFWLVIALAAPQLARRRTWRRPLPWFVAVYGLAISAFFVTARFRMPLVPPLIVLAAITVNETVRAVRAGRWRKLAAGALIVLVVAVASHAGSAGGYDPSIAQEHYRLGNRYLDAGQLDAAIVEFEQAAAAPPPNPLRVQALNNIATALLRNEQPRAAREILTRSLGLEPTAEGYARLGWAHLQEGRADSAQVALERSLTVAPSAEALYYRGQLAREQGRVESAIADWERGLELNPDPAQREILYYVLGRIHLESGRDPQRALDYLNRITGRFPDLEELRADCRAAGAR